MGGLLGGPGPRFACAMPPSRQPRHTARRAALCAACFAVFFSSGCAEWRSEKAFEKAVALMDDGKNDEALGILNGIQKKWPKTDAAAKSHHEIEWIEDLRRISAHGPKLMAWDAVRKVARAAESYRIQRRHYPSQFDELIPRFLSGPIRDPWGRRVVYRKRPGGYQVVSYGRDGLPGGDGLDGDLLVDTGREVRLVSQSED